MGAAAKHKHCTVLTSMDVLMKGCPDLKRFDECMETSLHAGVCLHGSGRLAACPEMSSSYFLHSCDRLCFYQSCYTELPHTCVTHAQHICKSSMPPTEIILDVEFDPVSLVHYIQWCLFELPVFNFMPSSLDLAPGLFWML